ncbi:hypothetical protein QBA75_07980 [Streptomyces stelliscabiei]
MNHASVVKSLIDLLDGPAPAMYGTSFSGPVGGFFSFLHSRGGHTLSPFFKGAPRITRPSSMVKELPKVTKEVEPPSRGEPAAGC